MNFERIYKPFYHILIAGIFISACVSGCSSSPQEDGKKYVSKAFDNGKIRYNTYSSDAPWKGEADEIYKSLSGNYDPEVHMIEERVEKWNYHTDKIGETYHRVSRTLYFVQAMLETGRDDLLGEVEASLEAVLALQQTDKSKDFYGVWPYFKEEPVLTKKTPVDLNMANFPAIALIDIYMGHSDRLSAKLNEKIKLAVQAACSSILRRQTSKAYTNVAIMDIWVLYAAEGLFGVNGLDASRHVREYYNYVKEVGGFNEFNSPTYTLASIRYLSLMRQHVSDADVARMLDELLKMEWSIVARHYHKPTGQWGGPHSRAYTTLMKQPGANAGKGSSFYASVQDSPFYAFVQHASKGAVNFGVKVPWHLQKIDMNIPGEFLEYFIAPKLPRLEKERFAKNFGVVGTNYMTPQYSLSSASNSTMWNQARPLLLYFRGEGGLGASLCPRFLHDGYDFSSVFFASQQGKNNVLCALSYLNDGADKHIYMDKLGGKFTARDLRLSFEILNSKSKIILPKSGGDRVRIQFPEMAVDITLKAFGAMKGKWEIGKDPKSLDYVIWSGKEKEFDFSKMDSAAIVFALEVSPDKPSDLLVKKNADTIMASWKGLDIVSKLKPSSTISHREIFHSEFADFPEEADPKIVGLRLAKKFLNSPNSLYGDTSKTPKQITYPDVCTWLGSLWFAKTTQNADLLKRLNERFLPLLDKDKRLQPKPNHVDNNVFGALALELFMQVGKPEYKNLGLMYADTQWILPENAKPSEKEWARQGYSWQTRLWLDDMFMINAVQSQAYRVTGKREYIDRAAREMLLYLEKIQCPNGLFYHSPETPFHWGRGNGWLAVGMAEVLRALPKDSEYRPEILRRYRMMMSSLLKYQAEDGMWRQLVDDKESWKETSSTAMFAYAMIVGVKNGWLDDPSYGWLGASSAYAKAARKAWLAMVKYIDSNDNVREVCMGTNIKNSRQHYMTRPRIVGDLHGQAPYIWCANALLE